MAITGMYPVAGPPSSGGGGTSTSGLTFETVDLTSGWTLLDPDSLVKSVTHADGYNTVTLNALGSGSNVYNWASGTTVQAPRWYKLLSVSGDQATEATRLALTARYQNDDSVNDYNVRVVYGSASDPTNTTATTIAGAGGSYARSTSGSTGQLRPAYGAWTTNAESINTGNNQTHAIMSQYRGNGSLGTPSVVSLDSSNDVVHNSSRSSSRNNLGTANIYLIVGIGTRGNSDTITEDDQVRFKLGFRAVSLEADS